MAVLLSPHPCGTAELIHLRPYEAWKAQTVDIMMDWLKSEDIKYYGVRKGDGRLYQRPWTKKRAAAVVDEAYLAARLNPSWGANQEEVAIKHIGTGWVESRWDELAMYFNSDGSLDVGFEQPNSCNWAPGRGNPNNWHRFCAKMGYPTKSITLLWKMHVNMEFAAYLNEMAIKNHTRVYHAWKTPKEKQYFDRMRAILMDPPEKDVPLVNPLGEVKFF